jgi:4-hydroxy-3-methylbut-2-enyl diphosphate reductase
LELWVKQIKKIYLVEKVEDVKKLPLNQNDEIAYVTQTTLSVDDTKDIIKEIKLHFNNVIEPKKNDICYATTNRQEAVKKIANQCDYFLVIGASNSSNSLRLVEVAKNYGSKKAILVEDVDSLNLNIFQESENIGITASASSPEVLVKKLLDNLKRNFEIHINEGSYQKEDVFFKVPQKLNV